MDYKFLTAKNAYIWRVVRRSDMHWLIEKGLYSGNNIQPDDNYKTMGSEELITKRNTRLVPIGNQGVLNDYIPFYFTPFSPMMYNIHTGYNGITQVHNNDVIILVASLNDLQDINFVFTDRHAYLAYANFYSDLEHLNNIDWDILQKCDFRRDNRERYERYQAEALIPKHLPVKRLRAILCYNESAKLEIESYLRQHDLDVTVEVAQYMYF